MKIVMLGYMASGKSIIANKLSSKINVRHIDLDDYIEQKENKSVKEIFRTKGEIYFRTIENKYLIHLLKSKEKFILSVGGGTPCYANNMELIKKHSNSIYLKVSIGTIYNRLIKEKKKRPLVSAISNSNLKEFIAKHLFERSVFYEKADNIVQVGSKSVAKIINELVKEIL